MPGEYWTIFCEDGWKELVNFFADPWGRTLCISVALILLSLCLVYLIPKLCRKRKKHIRTYYIFCIGIFLATLVLTEQLFYYNSLFEIGSEGISLTGKQNSWQNEAYGIFSALLNAIRAFAMDGDIPLYKEMLLNMSLLQVDEAQGADVIAFIQSIPPFPVQYYNLYMVYGSALYVIAPLLTFGFLLSFVKNLHAYWRYYVTIRRREVHMFSELNEQSLALARSVQENYDKQKKQKRKNGKRISRPMFIFADIIDKKEEAHLDFVEEAQNMRAILFRKDLGTIRLSRKNHRIYLISLDESEKIRHADEFIREYGNKRENVMLYLFSDSEESKCFMDSYSPDEIKCMKMQVMLVNDIKWLVYHNLSENGLRLFENAHILDSGLREITAVIVGLGRYGMEMLKALLWYCQLPGYRINIVAFDEDEHAESKFKTRCPELLPPLNTEDSPYDMRYSLRIVHAKVGTEQFKKELDTIFKIGYVFVCLGSDSQNIATARDIRVQLKRNKSHPDIETVVYDSALKQRTTVSWSDTEKAGTGFKKQNIHIIGDLSDFYSVNTIIDEKLLEAGLAVHQRWNNEDNNNSYYMNDYNLYSSLASALHRKLRQTINEYCSSDEVNEHRSISAEQFRNMIDARPVNHEAYELACKQASDRYGTNWSLDWDKEEDVCQFYGNFLRMRAATVFPFYYDQDVDSGIVIRNDEWKKTFAQIKNTTAVKVLSGSMDAFKERLYIILAYVHYTDTLKVPDRGEVIVTLKELMQEKEKKAPLDIEWMVDHYRNVINEWNPSTTEDGKKQEETKNENATTAALRLMFDAIVKFIQKSKNHQNLHEARMELEYDNLDKQQKGIVDQFMIRTCKAEIKRYREVNKIDLQTPDSVVYDRMREEHFLRAKYFALIEHVRWNAYMRTEGFTYTSDSDKKDDVSKLHPDLVSVDKLNFRTRIKDI